MFESGSKYNDFYAVGRIQPIDSYILTVDFRGPTLGTPSRSPSRSTSNHIIIIGYLVAIFVTTLAI